MTDSELTEDKDNVFAEAAAEVNDRREKSRLPNWWFEIHHITLVFALIPVALVLLFLDWLSQKMP